MTPPATDTPARLKVIAYATRALTSRGPVPMRALGEQELPRWKRWLYAAVALGLVAALFYMAFLYRVPSHPGVDQNGYLFGGKQFADTLTMKFQPTRITRAAAGEAAFDPHQFVGRMWVGADAGTPAERFYPKYPLGLPFLYAVSLWIGGRVHGVDIAYWISPVAMALAVLGTYLLARRFMGPFFSLMAMIVFATSPTTETYVNNPNSHAATVCCVVWGMFLLIRWWQRGGTLTGFAGGFLLGYAATIRYTEGTLIFPLLWVVLMTRPWRRGVGKAPRVKPASVETARVMGMLAGDRNGSTTARAAAAEENNPSLGLNDPSVDLNDPSVALTGRSLGRRLFTRFRPLIDSAAVVIGWAIPVTLLLVYNLLAMGTLTGYDATNESTGFSWTFFVDNWSTMLGQLNENGLFFVMPLAIAGLVGMFWWDWRGGVLMALWTVPCVLIYTFYYWAPDAINYLRFVLTILPALAIAAFWVLAYVRQLLPIGRPRMPAYLLLLTITFAGIGIGVAAQAGIRIDLATKTVIPFDDYFSKDPSRRVQQEVFWMGVLMFASLGAAVVGSAFLSRRIAPVLAAGLVTFLCVAGQTDSFTADSERDTLRRSALKAESDLLLEHLPPGSVLIGGPDDLLHNLTFVADYVLYQGWTFDHRSLERLPREKTDEAVLFDPARGRALWDRLGTLSQDQLNDQARETVVNALNAGRRVFVFDGIRDEDFERYMREKRPLPRPGFIQRYLPGNQFDTKLTTLWTQRPVEIDHGNPRDRGRRDRRGRDRGDFQQVVEVTMK